MNYESSYESGRRPFVADLKRGYWSSANDFIYAGLSLGFRLDVFLVSWFAKVETGVSGFIPTYLISLAFYVVPLLVVKSFMGQFSHSGFISAIRLCPIFKGIGYITLFLNICVLVYYSVFAMVPLFYLFVSFKPTLPWGCDGIREWTQEDVLLCPPLDDDPCDGGCYRSVASSAYFYHLFKDYKIFGTAFGLSWPLSLSVLCVWALIAIAIYKLSSTEKIGQLVRYSFWCIIVLLLLFIVRFSFLPGTFAYYQRIFTPNWQDFTTEIIKLPAYGVCAFGPGWGLFITLASFNRFKTNITRSSWLIGIGQMFIIFGLDMLEKFINLHMIAATDNSFYGDHHQFDTFFLSSGSMLASMEWPNLWSILFYFMLFLSSMVLMILQFHTILTSIFDEFIWLRQHKRRFTICLMSAMAVGSLYFSTLRGFEASTDLLWETFISQSLINLLLILMVTWIYGRVRFQRDMLFMTKERFATCTIYILRFFAPLCMLAVLLAAILISIFNNMFGRNHTTSFDVFVKALPWWSIPTYGIYSLYRSQGSLRERFAKCCRPTDWYPVEGDDRLRYEEAVNDTNMTHPLTELKCDDDEDMD